MTRSHRSIRPYCRTRERLGRLLKYAIYVCLLWGERRHHTFRSCPLWAKKSSKSGNPRANQDLSVCYGESGGTSCFNDDRVIGLRNLVTERVVIGLCDHVTERGASSKLSACAHQLPITNYQLPITTPPIGYPKVNQDFICLLLGERRYMSPNDAKHQSLRPCYRTRRRRGLIIQNSKFKILN